jgi:hypothetical protein
MAGAETGEITRDNFRGTGRRRCGCRSSLTDGEGKEGKRCVAFAATALAWRMAYINTGSAESLTRGPGDWVGPRRDLCADDESGKGRQVMRRRVDPGPRRSRLRCGAGVDRRRRGPTPSEHGRAGAALELAARTVGRVHGRRGRSVCCWMCDHEAPFCCTARMRHGSTRHVRGSMDHGCMHLTPSTPAFFLILDWVDRD